MPRSARSPKKEKKITFYVPSTLLDARESLVTIADKNRSLGVPTVAQRIKDLALSLWRLLRYGFDPCLDTVG